MAVVPGLHRILAALLLLDSSTEGPLRFWILSKPGFWCGPSMEDLAVVGCFQGARWVFLVFCVFVVLSGLKCG
ncbi:hypothetical protein Ancab_001471 [Ancistrocladus abbreviatus]